MKILSPKHITIDSKEALNLWKGTQTLILRELEKQIIREERKKRMKEERNLTDRTNVHKVNI